VPDQLIDFPKPNRHSLPSDRLKTLTSRPKQVDILRLDLIHPQISGNKWFKLKYNLAEAKVQGFNTLLSCGGPHSNHLHALAYAGQYFSINTHALVRGYEELPLTPTLSDCLAMGMTLEFVDKKTYRQRYEESWCRQMADERNAFWVAEGGNNTLGQQGCAEITQSFAEYDEVWLSIGSGCTFMGLAQAMAQNEALKKVRLQGVMAIKGGDALKRSLLAELPDGIEGKIDCESHFGGFGRCPEDLVRLIHDYDRMGLPLDPVYTAKLVAAFEHACRQDRLHTDKKYLLIHSGGLQGRRAVKALSASLP
jgi:1-aminocyclopropane-1-carboxylate deaminase